MNATSSGQPSKTRPPQRLRRRSLARASHALVAAVQMLTLCSFAHAAKPVTWQGDRSTDWNEDGNWKDGHPDDNKDVIIDDISSNITILATRKGNKDDLVLSLIVGDASVGVLRIQGVGTLIAGNTTLGNSALSFGTITLTGANASLTDSGPLFVGRNGVGNFAVSNGSLANVNGVDLGQGSRGNGNITVDNARFLNTSGLTIGDGSNGTFNILAGSDVTAFLVTTAQTVGTQGCLTLTGTNASLTITDTLVIASAGTSNLTISGGATLNTNTAGTNAANAVVFGQLASANANVTITGLNSGLISVGNVTVGKAGVANLTLSADGFLSTANLTLASQTGSTGTINIGAVPGSIAAPGSLDAATVFMGNGTATINLSHNSTNFSFSPVITGNGTVNVLAGTSIFLGNSTYSGSTIISPGATLQLGGVLGNTTSGAIINGVSDNGALISNRTNSFTLPGIIAGAGTFQQLGTGTTVLTANNSYTGTTTISAGTLQLGNVTNYGSLGTGAVVDNSVLAVNRYDIFVLHVPISGTGQFMQLGIGITALAADNTFTGNTTISAGTLQLGVNSTTGSVAGNITDNSVLAILHTNNLTLSNFISGTGQLQQLGSGTTILTANNTFSGLTTISAGSLQLGNGSTSGRVVGNINDATILAINRTNALTLPGTISGTGQLLQFGTGTTILTANNSYTGTTTISAGTLQLGDGGATGSVAGTITDSSILAINHSNILTLFNTISGTGQLQQIGTGTTILAADNTFTGTTTITAGTLQIGNAGTTGSIAGNIADNTSLTFNRSDSLTFAGVISGIGTMTKLGAGTLTLTAANSFTGDTTISAGTLQLGNNTPAGSVLGNITDNSILALNHSNNLTFSNIVSGTGQLQQLGTGTTILTANNSFSGGTTISAGGLVLGNGSTSGTVVGDIRNDATLSVDHVNTLTLPGTISGAGQFNQIGPGTTILTANNTYTGITNISAGTLQLGDGHATGSVAGSIADNSILAIDHANTLTLSTAISGSGQLQQLGTGTTILSANNSFSGGTTISAGTLQLGTGGSSGSLSSGAVIDNSVLAVNHLDAVGFTTTISGIGQFVQLGSGVTTLLASNTYTGNTTISAGTLQLGNNTTTGSVTGNITDNSILALNHSNAFTLPGLISGTGQLQQLGAGTTILTAINTLTGSTTISAGTLQLGNGGATGSLASSTVIDNSILAINHSDTLTLESAISGTGQFTQLGAGTTVLTADNTYTGITTISAGTLQLGDDHAIGSVAGNITDNNILAIDHANTFTLANTISGSGQLQQLGAGTTILAADNTFTGLTTISAGTLQLGNAGATGSLGGGALIDNSVLSINHTNTLMLSGAISGSGQFLQLGAGTTILGADNTFTGNTTISAGTLQLGDGNTTGSVAGNVTDNSILALNRSDAFTLPGLISGTGQLQQLGAGTTILTAINTLTGTTTISAGTLQLGNSGATGSLGLSTVIDNSVLAINHSDTLTLESAISGTGQFTQLGAGTTVLTADNIYTGNTTISAGTLQLGDGGATGSVAGNIIDNSVLALVHANTLTLSGILTGTGVLQQLGTGTTILAADNNFTGTTIISSGTLQLGNGGTTGAFGRSDVINASIFSVNHSNTLTLRGTISGAGQFLQLGPGTTILTADSTYTGATTISAGTLQLGDGNTTGSVVGDITNNSILALNHSGSFNFGNVVSGTGQLVQTGTGLTIVSSNNTYTGLTTISAGGLELGNGSTSGSVAGDIRNDAVLSVNHTNVLTLSGTISGSGAFDQIGTGTTILTADNSYSGITEILAGTVQLGDGHTTGSVAGNIVDNSFLAIDHANTIPLSSTISGSGQLQQLGTGSTILAADNSFTGLTTIAAGILQLGDAGTAGSLGTGAVLNNSLLTVNHNNTLTLSNAISGTGDFIQLGSGTTILTADSTFTGNTTISAGTLQLGNGNATGSVTSNIADNGILALNHSNAFTLPNLISGSGQLQQLGIGTTILTANNTLTGTTTISAGTLQLGNGGTGGSSGSGDVIDNSVLAVNRTNTRTLLGTISGTGQFMQLGTGTTILAADNTYTGITTISAGTLQLGNGLAIGSVASNITNNGNLTFSRSDDIAFNNVISGAGNVTKLDLNTLTFTANQTYTGLTRIDDGTLVVNGSMQTGAVLVTAGGTLTGIGTILGNGGASNVEIASGGRISPGTPDVAGTLTTTSLILSPTSQLDFQLGTADVAGAHDPTNDLLIVNGNLTLNGQLNITGSFGGAGTYRLIDYTGSLTDDGLTMGILPGDLVSSSFLVQTSIPGQINLIVQPFGTGALFWDGPNTTGNGAINGGTSTWNNTTANTNWTITDGSVNSQWNSSFAIFDVANGVVTIDDSSGAVSATGLQFAVNGYAVLGNSITLNGEAPVIEVGDGTPNGANFIATIGSVIAGTGTLNLTGLGTLVLTATNTYAGGTILSQGTLQIGSGGFIGTISGPILDDAALVFDHSDDLTFAGLISGNGTITKLGSGTLILTANNTVTGLITLSSGTLQVGNGGTTGSIAGDVLDSGALVFNRSDDITYNGVISGNGTLTKLGAGTLTLTNDGTFTGLTTISAGTLQIGNAGTTGSVAGNILDNAALIFNRSNDIAYAGVISGTGTVTKLGDQTLTLTGANTYTGLTTISAGTLQIGNGGTTGSIAGNIADNALLIFNRSDSLTYASVVSGNGSMIKLGAGTLTLTGANTLTGGTTISAGTLQIGNGGTTGSITGPIEDDAALVFNHSNNVTFAAAISGDGTVTKIGAGTLILTADNTYTGLTTISTGTLQIGNNTATGSITGDILDQTSLIFNRSDDTAYDGVISSNGTLTKLGAGTLTLTGDSTFTGLTTISAGTLQIGSAGVTGRVAGDILDNAALIFNRSNDITYAGAISGTGTVTKLGDQLLTLTGNSTFTGLTTISAGTLQIGNGATTGSVAANIADNAALIFNRSDSLTYDGVISGNGTLTKLGAGTLILTGANTYADGTTISAGTLQIGNGGTTGTITGPIEDDAALLFNHSNNVTFAAPISGIGTLTKLGAGTLTLTANNTYTGLTTISGGTLQIGNNTTTGTITGDILDQASLIFNRSDNGAYDGVISGNGTFTKLGAGTLSLTGDNTFTGLTTISTGTLQIGNAGVSGSVSGNILDNAALVFNRNDSFTYANVISGTGTVTKLGDQTLTLTGANTYTGITTISAGTLQIGNGGTSGSVAGNIVDNAALIFDRSNSLAYAGVISGNGTLTKLGAGTLTLTGANTLLGGTTIAAGALQIGNGGTSGSITGPVLDNASLIFNRSNTISFAAPISGAGTLTKLGTGTLILAADSTYLGLTTVSAGALQIGNGGATGSIAGNILDQASLIFNRSTDVSYDGVISGNGTITKIGAGTLTLTDDNSFTGNTTISAGTLQVGNGGTSGSIAGNILDNAAFLFNRGDSFTYANVISGNGTVTKIGDQTLTLTANNTYTGLTTISNGTLQIGNGATSGSIAGNILDNAALTFDHSNTITYAHVISGNGTLTKLGAGTLILTAANSFTGGTTLSTGALQIGNGGSGGSITGSIVNNAALLFNRSNNFAFGGVISGNGTVTKLGAGILTLTGNNSYTGGTTLSAGTLQIGNGGTSGSVSGNILDNAALAFNRSDNISYNDVISGSGTMTKLGTGTLILTGDNAYTGGTTLSAGTLQLGDGGAFGSVTGNILNNAALAFNHIDNVTFAGVISGNGTVTKLGDNTLTLASNNTFTGLTTISAGTLQVGNSGASGSIPGNILDNAALAFKRSDTLVYAGVISGNGTMAMLGPGTLILTAANAYTGGTTISAGTLQIGNGGPGGSIAGAVSDNSASLVFNRSNDFTFGGVIAGNGTTTKLGAGTLTLTGQNTYTGLTTLSAGALQIGNGSTTGTISGDILDNASLLFNRSDDVAFRNAISGSGALTKLGNNTLTLLGNNTFTGLTTISAGTLQVGAGVGSGGSLVGPILDNAALVFNRLNDLTLSGAISGSGSLTKLGPSTLTLAGNNTYTGLTTLSEGALQIGNGGASVSITGNILNNTALFFNRTGTLTYNGAISGNGTMTKLGAGTVIFTNNNTFTGGTTLSAGTLQIGNGGTTGSIAGNILDNAALAFDRKDNITVANLISGNGSLTTFGPGILTLTADNTYSGHTTVSAGTLQIGNGGTTGTVAGHILNNATLTFNRSDDVIFTNLISGTGTLTKLGAGTLTLTADNTYSGLTTISAGTLEIGNGRTVARSSGSVVGNILDNAALVFNRTDDITYRSIISGTGSITQQGDGDLLLTAANTYTGPTFVRGGILQVNGSINSDTTVDAGGILAGTGTIFGNVQNHGLITPGNPDPTFGALTIAGNYVGTGGQLVIRGAFGASNSPTDQLIISHGNASGDTAVSLVNVGGTGALTTGSGIPIIVTKNGGTTSADAFTLAGGSFVVGNFTYALVQGANDNWFLSSAPESPEIEPPPVVTGFRPEASLYSIVPAMSRELGVISIGTFHERQGDQSLLEQGKGWVPAAWGRVIGEHTEQNWSGTVNPSFDGAITGFQAGLDLYAYQEKGDDRDHFGIFAAYADAQGDVSGLAFDKPQHVGHTEQQATSAGIYYTHVANAGWYIDAVGMGSWYDATPSSDRGLGATIDGAGMSLSLEAGYPFKILPQKIPSLVLEPQAQIFYQYSSYGTSHDSDGSIQYDDSNAFTGRIGGRLQIDVPLHHMLFKPYALANLWQNFATTDHLFLSDSGNIDTKNAATSIEMGLGLTAQITKNIALYGGGSYITNLDSNNEKTFFGDFGLRVTW